MLKHKKAQTGAIGGIMLFIVFIVMWFVWLGGWVGEVGKYAVEENSLTGVDAFFYSNLNVFVFLGITLGIMGFMYFSSGA
jgi:hypothetical protein